MMMLLRARLIFALLFLGLGLMFYGHVEYKQADRMQAKPAYISCSAFERKGPPEDNYHVELSAFKVTKDMWHASLAPAGSNTFYSAAWVPVYPRNRATEPRGEKYRVILRFNGIKGEAELEQLVKRATVTGVVNPKGVLPLEAYALLEEGYPGLDSSKCYVIGVDQAVPTRSRALGFFAGGLACLGVFGGWMFWAFKDSGRTKYGGDAKIDTSAPDFLAKRMSTDIDPEKFRQMEAVQETEEDESSVFAEDDLEPAMSFKEEDLAYRREFAEKYGLGGDFVDDSPQGGAGSTDGGNGQMLNY